MSEAIKAQYQVLSNLRKVDEKVARNDAPRVHVNACEFRGAHVGVTERGEERSR